MTFADPEKNIKQFQIKEGERVADFGAGSGFYTMAAARAAGPRGYVFAIDVHKEITEKIKSEASHLGLHNVEVIWADLEMENGSKLSDQSVHRAIVSNILFQIENKKAFAKEVARIVKNGGEILVIDWTDSFGGLGPRPEVIFSEKSARRLFEDYGFKYERKIDAGNHHYGIIMKHV